LLNHYSFFNKVNSIGFGSFPISNIIINYQVAREGKVG